ncbi:ABC transporter ATP-binding protein [Oceanobacillus halophilus]|uniref:ABC transporter ATP-binding protein n=1 Tax=Oceanobacillus halophilus TaxID=930130 RepID=A0A494ZW22_9BACI|nr:ABC transporter ATP-binding protein [Oceanobacillus halophilus]RKQ30782.1 ABC transporter ATP-binding protein [Oceanobacillus halophilus]
MRKVQPKQNPLLKVDQFSFAYENINKPLFKELNFCLYENEVTLLLGASGSGKSSLALCLNGLYPDTVEGVTSGQIYYEGKNISDYPKGEVNQQIGIVFQDPESQFCMITVEDELAFTLENRKVPTSRMSELITEVLHLVGMENFRTRKIHELSGGQKQKVALAAVLLLEPKLLILDEPTANLDPYSTLEFIKLIERLQKKRHFSILVIEHQSNDWTELINRVLVIGQDGTIKVDDTSDNFFQKYQQLLSNEGIFQPHDVMDIYRCQDYGTASPSEKGWILTIEHLRYTRKEQAILNNINLKIRYGEFIALIGENGAGKSTLLQLMAGLLLPDEGEVLFKGQSLICWKENELRKQMGYVFQNPEHQFITDTVYDELTFAMKLNNISKTDMKEIASTLMTQFHLEKHQYDNPFSLSGGQKRRLSVATMLDETPDILLFDEPTFGQDAKTTQELMKMIWKLKQNGTTIIFVTHDMDIVDLTDRAMVLHNQEVIYEGVPETLWQQEELLKKTRLRPPSWIRKNVESGVFL